MSVLLHTGEGCEMQVYKCDVCQVICGSELVEALKQLAAH
jgi:hypothetical protein